MNAESIVKELRLSPHPEGGFYREISRSKEMISKQALPDRYTGDRSFYTSIYFLLEEEDRSVFHRIQSDEIWYFHLGGPLSFVQISPDGELDEITMGIDLSKGELLQYLVPAGYWFGAMPKKASEYSLVSCSVHPGFDFADFEMAQKSDLLRQYPQHKDWIEKLS